MTPVPTVTISPTSTMTPVPTVTISSTPTMTISPTSTLTPTPVPTVEPTIIPVIERNFVKQKVLENIAADEYSKLSNYSDSWWFKRKENHKPSGSGEEFDISKYQGVYLNKDVTEEDKVIYLTIDCGYGSDNTAVLLDIFKKHEVEVTFFVTNFFLKANPEEVCRMADEGHLVGNHSVTHPDLTTLTDEEIYPKSFVICMVRRL